MPTCWIDEDMECWPIRDIPFHQAVVEILEYIASSSKSKVYISEIVYDLLIDMDWVVDIYHMFYRSEYQDHKEEACR